MQLLGELCPYTARFNPLTVTVPLRPLPFYQANYFRVLGSMVMSVNLMNMSHCFTSLLWGELLDQIAVVQNTIATHKAFC